VLTDEPYTRPMKGILVAMTVMVAPRQMNERLEQLGLVPRFTPAIWPVSPA